PPSSSAIRSRRSSGCSVRSTCGRTIRRTHGFSIPTGSSSAAVTDPPDRFPYPTTAEARHVEAKLGILTGARAGETLSRAQRAISVGRHPEVDLRFDPASDRAVSARHALLFYEDGNWYIRDLGSRNGTFVNDRPVREDLRLRNGDRITFGVQGPTVQFATDRASLTGFAAASPAARDSRGPSTAERLRIELVRRTRRYRAAAIGLVVVAAGVVGTILFLGDRQRAAWDRERTAMRLQIDSLHSAGSRAIESLEQQLSALTSSLRASELRIQELQEAIAAAESRGNIGEAEGLRR